LTISVGDGLKPKKRPAGFDPKKATDHSPHLLHEVTALLIASNPIDPQGIFGPSRNEVSLSIFAFLFAEVVEHLDFQKTVQLRLENGKR